LTHGQVYRNDVVTELRGSSYEDDDTSAGSMAAVQELEKIRWIDPDEFKTFKALVYHNWVTDGVVEHEQGKHSL
jgi:hypothetical protein